MNINRMNVSMIIFLTCISVVFASGPPAGDDFSEENEACLDCHDDIPEKLQHTVHNPIFKVGCVDCHGYNEEHIDDPELDNIIGARGAEGMKACVTCHEADIHEKRPRANMHASASVYCNDCHSIHDQEGRLPDPLLKESQTDLCLSCHAEVRTLLNKPYNHKLAHGVVACASCHDPHGGKGRKRFRHGMGGEDTCLHCHTDKKGPFVFPHVTGITGDCMTCHEPHGSSNPRQLTRAHISQLCLECHATLPATTLGSQPPATHNLRSPRYRNCTVCHTAVHGSSRSPALLK